VLSHEILLAMVGMNPPMRMKQKMIGEMISAVEEMLPAMGSLLFFVNFAGFVVESYFLRIGINLFSR
jgi:hypothetical protein